ncbi:unnamed protein product [Schistocephalus solidus]|uniref:Adenylate cyclase n=1 Tax=Schistocephalus solidus TaxID=70667 RepID=A0A183SS47_SCHSO|nr:unnamed protein product [Schistocephalus solidus]
MPQPRTFILCAEASRKLFAGIRPFDSQDLLAIRDTGSWDWTVHTISLQLQSSGHRYHQVSEMDDGHVFEILRNLSLAPHLVEECCEFCRQPGPTVLVDFRWIHDLDPVCSVQLEFDAASISSPRERVTTASQPWLATLAFNHNVADIVRQSEACPTGKN